MFFLSSVPRHQFSNAIFQLLTAFLLLSALAQDCRHGIRPNYKRLKTTKTAPPPPPLRPKPSSFPNTLSEMNYLLWSSLARIKRHIICSHISSNGARIVDRNIPVEKNFGSFRSRRSAGGAGSGEGAELDSRMHERISVKITAENTRKEVSRKVRKVLTSPAKIIPKRFSASSAPSHTLGGGRQKSSVFGRFSRFSFEMCIHTRKTFRRSPLAARAKLAIWTRLRRARFACAGLGPIKLAFLEGEPRCFPVLPSLIRKSKLKPNIFEMPAFPSSPFRHRGADKKHSVRFHRRVAKEFQANHGHFECSKSESLSFGAGACLHSSVFLCAYHHCAFFVPLSPCRGKLWEMLLSHSRRANSRATFSSSPRSRAQQYTIMRSIRRLRSAGAPASVRTMIYSLLLFRSFYVAQGRKKSEAEERPRESLIRGNGSGFEASLMQQFRPLLSLFTASHHRFSGMTLQSSYRRSVPHRPLSDAIFVYILRCIDDKHRFYI